jgi:lipopolysaccharide transport system permease protein
MYSEIDGTHVTSRFQPSTGRRDLLGLAWTLVRTDFKSRYHGSFGGFVWALLKPLAMFLVLVAVFSFVFQTEPQYRLKLVIGIFLFDFFADATRTGFVALQAKGFLVTKVRFPTWILVVTSVSNPLITLAIFSAIVFAALVVAGQPPAAAHLLLYVWYLLHYIVVVIGISLAASVMFVRYRDLNQVWDVVVQAGFFLAPIVYPIGVIPERFHRFLYFWPPTPIIQFSRAVLVDGTAPTLRAHLLLTVFALLILATGLVIFGRYSPRAAEYL